MPKLWMAIDFEPSMIKQLKNFWVIDGDINRNFNIDALNSLEWEIDILNYVKPYLRKKYTTVDVGGNIGCQTSFFQKHSGVVVSYEPNPEAFQCLTRNCLSSINYQLALGNEMAETYLTIEHEDTGLCHIASDDDDCRESDSTSVSIVTLDEHYKTWYNPDYPIGFIKIDVEGFEPQVLNGAEEVISKFHPVLFIEVF